jgi:hypothetical protein
MWTECGRSRVGFLKIDRFHWFRREIEKSGVKIGTGDDQFISLHRFFLTLLRTGGMLLHCSTAPLGRQGRLVFAKTIK